VFEPYEDRQTWVRLLIADMRMHLWLGEPRSLMGPTALRERVELRFGCTTATQGVVPSMLATPEERRYCLAYSDRRAWIHLLVYDLRMHVRRERPRRLQGPPGLRERMERLYAYLMWRFQGPPDQRGWMASYFPSNTEPARTLPPSS